MRRCIFFIAEFFREHSRLLLREAEQQDRRRKALATLIAALHEYLKRLPRFFSAVAARYRRPAHPRRRQ